MSISRLVPFAVLCLVAGACTVVIQQPAESAEPGPTTVEPESQPETDRTDPELKPDRRYPEPVIRPAPERRTEPEVDPREPTTQEPTRREPEAQEPAPREPDPTLMPEPRRPEPVINPDPQLPNTDPEPDPRRPEPEPRPDRPDPDDDEESGKKPGGSTASNLGIPPAHLPDPGECRVWVEGTPAGRQAGARTCHGILETAPPDAWVLYIPAQHPEELRVRYLHEQRPVVVAVRVYDSKTGHYLRDLPLSLDDDNMGPVSIGAHDATQDPGRTNPRNSGNTASGGNSNKERRSTDEPTGNERAQSNGRDVGSSAARPDTTSGGNDRSRAGNENSRGNDGQKAKPNEGSQGRNQPVGADAWPDTANTTSGGSTVGNDGNRRDEVRPDNAGQKTRGQAGDVTAVTVETPTEPGSDRDATGTGVSRGNKGQSQSGRAEGPEDTATDVAEEVRLSINSRYYPVEGQCRIWVPGLPAGRQAKPTHCDGIAATAPAGAWILRRPSGQPNVIQVDYVDEARAGVVVRTSAYDANTGAPLQTDQPGLP